MVALSVDHVCAHAGSEGERGGWNRRRQERQKDRDRRDRGAAAMEGNSEGGFANV